ncbi:uncharacterized protein LOC143266621 [Megachile rotundata]|uniref:uncharacterized protein LOC143266621 n=1 Tax=Megachile rotundata TaxID=143995 RepID=UPI003FCF9C7B
MASSTFNIRPLTKDKYDSWVMQMEAVTVKNGTWKFVNGKIPRPTMKAGLTEEQLKIDQEKWDDDDARARADLIIAIDPSLLRLVKGLDTAAQVWCRLRSEFASTGPVKKSSLLKRISTFKMVEGVDLRTQLMEFFDVTAQLESLDIPINPELLSYMFLNSLPPSFAILKCTMESHDTVPSAEIIRQKVLEEHDSRIQQKDDGKSEAMWVQKSRERFQGGRGDRKKENSRQMTERTRANLVNKNISAVNIDVKHRRLGHLNVRDVLKVSKEGLATGMSISSEKWSQPCDVCLRGKMTVLPFPKGSKRSSEVLNIVHSDVWGPSRTESFRRARYFVTFIDDYSRWCEVFFLQNKSDVLRAFKVYKARVENQTGKKIKYLMTDNGRKYCNREFDEFLNESGIRRRLTVAHTPQQNGVAERKNRTLVDMAHCLLTQTGLSGAFWAETLTASNYLRNRCPTASLEGHEYWYKRIPDLNNLKAYSAKAYVLQKEPGRGKFEPRSKEGVLVGYSEESKGYRVYVPEDKKVVVTRDVKFLEEGLVEAERDAEDTNGTTQKLDEEKEGLIELQINQPERLNEDNERPATQPVHPLSHSADDPAMEPSSPSRFV